MTLPDAHFGQDAVPLHGLSDSEFLRAIRFNRNAPPPMVKAATAGDVARFTRQLAPRQCVVRRGGRGKRVAKIAERRPALWSAGAFDDSQRTAELVQLWESFGGRARAEAVASNGSARSPSARWSSSERRLLDWLEGAATAPIREFELLLLLEMLPALGRALSPAVRWTLWRTALTAAIGLCGRFVVTGFSRSLDRLKPVTTNIQTGDRNDPTLDRVLIERGELPFRAGLVFAGVKSAAKIRRAAVDVLSRALNDVTDDNGAPAAELVAKLPLWLAPIVRTRQWAAAMHVRSDRLQPVKGPAEAGHYELGEETRQRLEQLIRAVAPLCRADGRLALGNGETVSAVPILREAAAAAGLRRKSPPAKLLAALWRSRIRESSGVQGDAGGNSHEFRYEFSSRAALKASRKAAGIRAQRDRPGMQSDASRLACLRTDWSPRAAVLVVAHDDVAPRVDLSVAGVSILEGAWPVEVTFDGEPVAINGHWDCTCWFSDRDVDFMELQHKAERGVIIDRQVLLSRGGEFAVFVDCIVGDTGKPLTARSQLPVAPGMHVAGDTETRELRCKRAGTAVRCYPLSLPCDRVHGAAGRFDDAGTIRGFQKFPGLSLSQTSVGGLIAPVVLDWSSSRRKQEAEWRQLTVAADGRRVPLENAGGYRLRVGDLHLVVYRSLRQTDQPRTVLGMHTKHETVIGRFLPDGTIDPLLLVE